LKKRPFGDHITYLTLDISYNDYKKVRIRKIHKDLESEELKKSKYKIDVNETYIYDNQIDLDMFLSPTDPFDIFIKKQLKPKNKVFNPEKNDFSKYLGNVLRVEKNLLEPEEFFTPKFGIYIYVGMKNPDEELNDNLCSVLHQLCKMYLKPGVIFTSKEGIICKIDDCSYSGNLLKKFLEDFVITTESIILKEI
jgi:hypothetical protein